MAVINFDARNVQPDEGRNSDPVPSGWYVAMMSKSEMKPTKDGMNAMLACTFDIVEPPQYKGRKIFFNFNLQHQNAQTVEIAFKQFSAVCHAVGHLMVADSQELHGKPLKLKLKTRPATYVQGSNPPVVQYEASNDIEAFKNVADPTAVDGPKAAPAPAFAAPPAFQPPAAGAWVPPTVQQAQPPAAAPAWQAPAQPPAAAPVAPPAAAPAWQAPPGAVAQPWAQQQAPAPAAAPVAPPAPAAPPPGMAPAWQPPAAPGGVAPPWQQ